MNGFVGTRVIIVDDEEKEALPILKELSRRGIPATYFDGTQRGLPPKKQRLSGVRLAILDMDLVGGGVPDKSKMSTLMNYIKGILDPQNGPYGVIAWTGNAYLRPEFENSIFADIDIPKPIFTITLDKQDCQVKGKFKLDILSKRIDEAITQFSPLLLLQVWEEKCFIAATKVSNELATLVTGDAANLDEWRSLWRKQFLELMHAMAVAEAGQQLNGDSCLSALYGSMNPLHADRMESNVPGLYKSLSNHYSAEIMASVPTTDMRAKAKLNTMLHLAIDGMDSFYAGNIYTQSKLQARIPSVKRLLDDLVMGKDDPKEQAKKELATLSKSIVVEVNATCDHAQNNIRIARFIAGLMVPEKGIKKIKKADYIYKLGPVFLESKGTPSGVYYFYLSARHLLTIELNELTNAKMFARLRGQAFADLQAWFTHRAARPGMLMLTE